MYSILFIQRNLNIPLEFTTTTKSPEQFYLTIIYSVHISKTC